MYNWKRDQHDQEKHTLLAPTADKVRGLMLNTAHGQNTPTRPLHTTQLRELLTETPNDTF